MDHGMGSVEARRLTDPDLDFWVDLRLMRQSDRWLAVADLAGEPEVGLGPTRQVAILFALWSQWLIGRPT